MFISDGPSEYSDSMACMWVITSPGPIEVAFLDFNTERGYDFVEVHSEGVSKEQYSGSDVPDPVRTKETVRNVTISFVSDSSGVSEGFIAKIRVIQPGETASPTTAPTFPTAGATSRVFRSVLHSLTEERKPGRT